jgi:hypothetical protein
MSKIKLLVISLFSITFLSAQNIYIFGKVKPNDINEISSIINFIDQKFNYKKLNVHFQGNTEVYVHKKKSPASASILDRKLNEYYAFSANYNESDVDRDMKKVPFSERVQYSYDRKRAKSNYNSNNINELIEQLKNASRKEKIDVVLKYSTVKPIINITTPSNNDYFRYMVQGTTTGESIKMVMVRINSGVWKTAYETKFWSYSIHNKSEVIKLIEAIAISQDNDTSEIESINTFRFAPFNMNSLTYLYPNNLQNAVRKCNNNGYSFSIKFKLTPGVDISKLKLVIEDKNNNIRYSENVTKFPENSIRLIPREGMDEYCLFLIYSILFDSPCSIDDRSPFYYYLTYIDGDQIIKTKRLKIYFSSFDSDSHSDYQICDCN